MLTQYQQLLAESNYSELIKVCNDHINQDCKIAVNYWYLSLALLLQGHVRDPELIRLQGLKNSDTEEVSYTEEFYQILNQESLRQEKLKEYGTAWRIRQFVRQHIPYQFDNLVQMVYLSLHLKTLTIELLQELNIPESVKLNPQKIDSDDTLQLFQNILFSTLLLEQSLDFFSSLLPYLPNPDACIDLLLYVAPQENLERALSILDLCEKYSSNNIFISSPAVSCYLNEGQYLKAIELARTTILSAENLWDKIVANHSLLSALMFTGGHWQEAELVFEEHLSLLELLVRQNSINIPMKHLAYICVACFFTTYFRDNPKANHTLQQQVLKLLQSNYQQYHLIPTQNYQKNHSLRVNKSRTAKKLKIGYLSTSLRLHSIGWLARSLFQYHDRENFEIYGYFPGYKKGDDFL